MEKKLTIFKSPTKAKFLKQINLISLEKYINREDFACLRVKIEVIVSKLDFCFLSVI